MQDPIHVRRKKGGQLVLIAGGHRLEAAKRLDWTEIEAKVWGDVTDDWTRMMEIDDNLAGAELNPLDTALFLAARKEVYERLHPETRALAFKGNRHTGSLATDMMSVASFATATAEKFGMTDRHVRRLIAAGAALKPGQVEQLRQSARPVSLADLQVIAKPDPDQRVEIVGAIADGKAKSAAEAFSGLKAPCTFAFVQGCGLRIFKRDVAHILRVEDHRHRPYGTVIERSGFGVAHGRIDIVTHCLDPSEKCISGATLAGQAILINPCEFAIDHIFTVFCSS